MTRQFKVGLIGCGRISDIYLKNCQRFPLLDVVACAALDMEEANAKAEAYQIPSAVTPQEIFENDEIECVLNLTIPAAHSEISLAALHAGKHVYSEKPFVTDLTDGQKILDLATERNLLVGNAPDTFLGGRWQVCRELIDQGVIGKPTGVTAFVGTHGVERHHPNPDFYYKIGGGPLLDLGPYYLTAMVFLLGPIKSVSGMARRTFDQRMIENGPRYGEMMDVEVDTHVLSNLEFQSGEIGSMTMSFDVWDSETPRFEIYGEEGTICIPDPDPVHGANIFGGNVWFRTKNNSRWTHQPRPTGRENWLIAENNFGFNDDCRGLGLLDLAHSVRTSAPHRANGVLAMHICEVMEGILKSAETGSNEIMKTSCERPRPMSNLSSDQYGATQ